MRLENYFFFCETVGARRLAALQPFVVQARRAFEEAAAGPGPGPSGDGAPAEPADGGFGAFADAPAPPPAGGPGAVSLRA